MTNKNYLRRNFVLGILHGIFYSFGLAFSHPETVIMSFLALLNPSEFILGIGASLIGSFGNISGVLPQLFAANFLETKKKKKPFLVLSISLRALCWLFLAVATFIFSGSSNNILILIVILVFLIVIILLFIYLI